MGQREVLDTLANKGWRTKTQIAEELCDFQVAGINECLRRLVKGGFVERKKCPEFKHGYLYRIKEDEDDENE